MVHILFIHFFLLSFSFFRGMFTGSGFSSSIDSTFTFEFYIPHNLHSQES